MVTTSPLTWVNLTHWLHLVVHLENVCQEEQTPRTISLLFGSTRTLGSFSWGPLGAMAMETLKSKGK